MSNNRTERHMKTARKLLADAADARPECTESPASCKLGCHYMCRKAVDDIADALAAEEQAAIAADAALMREAVAEIEWLRGEVKALAAYKQHTERMLALFEGGPRMEGGGEMGPDVVWKLRERLGDMREPEESRP